MATRRMFIGGNHKCNGGVATTAGLGSELASAVGSAGVGGDVDVVVAPAAPFLLPYAAAVAGSSVGVAVQDVCGAPAGGAYTGTVSVAMAAECGAAWAIVGHSERRHVYAESEDETRKKIAAVLSGSDLGLIYCVGETLAEREAGDPFVRVAAQMDSLFAAGDADSLWHRIVVAYEPVWAIGTGEVATPEQAQDMHARIRSLVAERVSPAAAAALRIIYGGSVKRACCEELIVCPDIDGFLVGGASLKPEFADIVIASHAAVAAAAE